jgi:hypothetical protein
MVSVQVELGSECYGHGGTLGLLLLTIEAEEYWLELGMTCSVAAWVLSWEHNEFATDCGQKAIRGKRCKKLSNEGHVGLLRDHKRKTG